MEEIIKFIISNYFLTFFIVGLFCALFSLIAIKRKSKSLKKEIVYEKLFSYYLLFAVGFNNIVNFIFHVFYGDMAAEFIGWAQSPFQAEVGFASLGVGIVGILAFKASLPFRVAALIPPSVFSLGAAGGHIYQMVSEKNYSPGNVGFVLPMDILIPITGFIFLWLSYKFPLSKK